jgi:hypothetical protein
VSFTLRWTPAAKEAFDDLQEDAQRAAEGRKKSGKAKSSKQQGLFKQVAKAVQRLGENPKHPGLQTHEFHSLEHPYDPNGKVFEAYAQQHTPGAYRIFWCYGPGRREITIIAITPHP